MTDKELKLEAIDLIAKLATAEATSLSTTGLRMQTEQWQSQSPEHRQAWQQAEQAWTQMADLDVEPSANKEPLANKESSENENQLANVEQLNKSATIYSNINWKKHRTVSAIAASVVSAVIAFTLLMPLNQSSNTPAVSTNHVATHQYSNARQLRHSVTLADGTVAHLNFNSAIEVRFELAKRSIKLVKGEAFFEVAKNPARPFIVTAGKTTATAIGTAFTVRLENEAASRIVVTEGIVGVNLVSVEQDASEINKPSINPLTVLKANEAVNSTGQEIGKVQTINAKNIAAWTKGVLVFNDTPLDQALAEIDRYTAYRIKFNAGYLGAENVTGTFFINRLDQELSSLVTSFDLEIIDDRNGILELGVPRLQRPTIL